MGRILHWEFNYWKKSCRNCANFTLFKINPDLLFGHFLLRGLKLVFSFHLFPKIFWNVLYLKIYDLTHLDILIHSGFRIIQNYHFIVQIFLWMENIGEEKEENKKQLNVSRIKGVFLVKKTFFSVFFMDFNLVQHIK